MSPLYHYRTCNPRRLAGAPPGTTIRSLVQGSYDYYHYLQDRMDDAVSGSGSGGVRRCSAHGQESLVDATFCCSARACTTAATI